MNIYLAFGLIIITNAINHFMSFRKGFKKGELFREKEILNEYCAYIPVGEIGEMADELMEEDGYSENFPIMLIMPDKYDYIEGEVPSET